MRKLILTLLILFAGAAHAEQPLASQGEYLARLGDCTSCHTAPGGKPFAGGYPVNSPFGVIYGTNITPDKQYGIGEYSFDDFSKALRKGVAKDGRHLYPAMPYTAFAGMSDKDMHALYDYFMHEVAPVNAAPPKTKLSFPFNQRWGLAMWNTLFLNQDLYKPDQSHDEKWNRGAYIVQTLGHCSACHSPRGVFFQEKGSPDSKNYLTGETLDQWYAPNLRQDKVTGLGRWSEDDIAEFLKSGHGGNTMVFGAMKQAVENSLQYMTEDDRKAVGHYLLSLADNSHHTSLYEPSLGKTSNELPGAGLYDNFCSSCHMENGNGRGMRAPALAGNPSVISEDPASVIHIVLEGEKALPGSLKMPAFGNKFSDRQVADVVNYIRESWGNRARIVTEDEVKRLREQIEKKKQPEPSISPK